MTLAAIRKELNTMSALVDRLEREPSAEKASPVDWSLGVSGHDLDPWQSELLDSDSRRQLLLCARQTGKTESVALKAAYEAAHAPAWCYV